MMKYLIIGRRAKELNELLDKYKALETEYREMREKRDWIIDKLRNEIHDEDAKHKQEIDALYTSLADKDETIQKLQSKIDILHEYYDMDEEPSQEIKTKMRINERIHDLELENIELRNNVRMRDEVQKQALNYVLGQAHAQLAASQTAFLPRAQRIVFTDDFSQSYYSY